MRGRHYFLLLSMWPLFESDKSRNQFQKQRRGKAIKLKKKKKSAIMKMHCEAGINPHNPYSTHDVSILTAQTQLEESASLQGFNKLCLSNQIKLLVSDVFFL